MVNQVSSSLGCRVCSSVPTSYSRLAQVATAIICIALGIFVPKLLIDITRKYFNHSLNGRAQPEPRDEPSIQPTISSSPDEQPVDAEVEPFDMHSRDYPQNISETLGGEKIFASLPIFTPQEAHLVYKTKEHSYLYIIPKEMTASIMRGTDRFKRPFIAIRYQQKGTQKQEVAVLLRHKTNTDNWYLNEEVVTHERLTLERGTILYFIRQLMIQASLVAATDQDVKSFNYELV